MITLITGGTGTGKTALAVSMLAELKGTRPIFSFGIRELKLDHQPTPPLDDWTVMEPTPEDPNLLQPVFTFPPNSIIVIDEAQNIYRPRASTAKVPSHVAAFEAHRHKGIDFWIITQDLSLIDANVRRLVRRHIHVRENFLGRKIYEWPEVGSPDVVSSRQVASSRSYKLPKETYSLYKSADFHTAPLRKRKPIAFYIAIACIPIIAFFGWRIATKLDPKPVQADATVQPALQTSQVVDTSQKPVSMEDYVYQRTPRLPSVPHSAPIYDQITRPTRAPVVAGCVATSSRCRCYSQDATPIQIDESACRQIVAGGQFIDFNPEGQQQGRAGIDDAPSRVSPGIVSAPAPLPMSVLASAPQELSSQ